MKEEHVQSLQSAFLYLGGADSFEKEATNYLFPAGLGAGVGGILGLLRAHLRKDEDEEPSYLRSALLHALLGAGAGLGGAYLLNQLRGLPVSTLHDERSIGTGEDESSSPNQSSSNVVGGLFRAIPAGAERTIATHPLVTALRTLEPTSTSSSVPVSTVSAPGQTESTSKGLLSPESLSELRDALRSGAQGAAIFSVSPWVEPIFEGAYRRVPDAVRHP